MSTVRTKSGALGEQIKKRGLTMTALQTTSTVDRKTLSRINKGEKPVRRERVAKVADALRISPDELINEEEVTTTGSSYAGDSGKDIRVELAKPLPLVRHLIERASELVLKIRTDDLMSKDQIAVVREIRDLLTPHLDKWETSNDDLNVHEVAASLAELISCLNEGGFVLLWGHRSAWGNSYRRNPDEPGLEVYKDYKNYMVVVVAPLGVEVDYVPVFLGLETYGDDDPDGEIPF